MTIDHSGGMLAGGRGNRSVAWEMVNTPQRLATATPSQLLATATPSLWLAA